MASSPVSDVLSGKIALEIKFSATIAFAFLRHFAILKIPHKLQNGFIEKQFLVPFVASRSVNYLLLEQAIEFIVGNNRLSKFSRMFLRMPSTQVEM
ncbi:MAG: hypothetical protein ACJAYJ_002195 [Saprospiraceae bacterium]|jgi:hypothetical protein